mgnify:CR=1 FL=1
MKNGGNVSDVLLEFQYHYNQQNTKKTKVDFSFIHHREKSFFKPIKRSK